MNQTEKDALKEIQGTKGWQVLEFLVKIKIDELRSVESLDERSIEKAGVQALAQKKAVKLLNDFLADMGFTQSTKETNKTYE
jgi:hypothetical protein